MSLTLLEAVSAINDASMLIQALTPLVEAAKAQGKEVITDEDVDAERAKYAASIIALDSLIAKRRAGG